VLAFKYNGTNDGVLGVSLDATTVTTFDGGHANGVAVTGNATLTNQSVRFTVVNNVITVIALSSPL
jgi:hypothetical protein